MQCSFSEKIPDNKLIKLKYLKKGEIEDEKCWENGKTMRQEYVMFHHDNRTGKDSF